MKSILKKPMVNALCISLFSAFYAVIFIITSGKGRLESVLYYNQNKKTNDVFFWSEWSRLLAAGYHAYIAYALIALTILVVAMLFLRRRHYDEYHVAILLHCLATATVLTLTAIAVFYIRILNNPVGIVEKFTLFIAIHWISVVFADMAYVFICRWR